MDTNVHVTGVFPGAIEKGSYEIFIGSDARFLSRLSRFSPKRAAAVIYSQMKDLLA
jgi:hypothetical protein